MLSREISYQQKKYFTILMLLMTSLLTAGEYPDDNFDAAIGIEIMNEVYIRHQQFSFIYEEQSMVMVDRNGDRDTRKVRRYSRIEEDGSVKFLLLFYSPNEINGVALLANRDVLGKTNKYIYLPAFGEQLIENLSSEIDGSFLGTDFSIENLAGEILDDYIYIRRPDKKLNNVEYFVIDVYQKERGLAEAATRTEKLLNRRHFICKDNFYITKTEYFDIYGKVFKKQSHHDLRLVDNKMWRANMILMEDSKEKHQSLIKITRRVFSRDYVSAEIFTAEWLFKNYPFIKPDVGDEKFLAEDKGIVVMPDGRNDSSADIEMGIVQ